MTTKEKLNLFKNTSGRNWGNIADLLGVSRQMMDMVRKGNRNFSSEIEEKLNSLCEKITTKSSVNTRDNIIESLTIAQDRLMQYPDGPRMVSWAASAMIEASEAIREHDAGNHREAYARAYESQRIFGRIFRTAFDQQ